MRAPSASSRSAEPDRLVAERLPCLATRQPAPAATNAAVVETLKVGAPPPGAGGVEQVVAVHLDRRAPARASCARGPSARRRSRPSCAARSGRRRSAPRRRAPLMISRSTSCACSAVRSCPEATASIASRRPARSVRRRAGHLPQRQEVAAGSACPLRSAPTRGGTGRPRRAARGGGSPITVPARLGRQLELVRQVRVHDQRVVAPGRRAGSRRPAKMDRPSWRHLGGLAVHGLADHDAAAEGLRQRLVAEAHARAPGCPPRRTGGRPRSRCPRRPAGRARARSRPGPAPRAQQLVDRRAVVAHHVGLRPQLAQVLDEVVGEAVVVVDHEHVACSDRPTSCPVGLPAGELDRLEHRAPPSRSSRGTRRRGRSRRRRRRPPARARCRP